MRLIVRGVKLYRSKGRLYCYHRKTGKRILSPPGTAAFFAEINALESATVPPAPRAGTLGMLFAKYRAAWSTIGLSPRTQADYQRVLDWLKPLDALPLVEITPPFAAALRDRTKDKRGFRFANYVISVLSAALSWGAEHGEIDRNPIKGHVKRARRPKELPQRNRPWTTEEREVVISEAEFHVKVPLALMRWAGLRAGDALTAPKTAYDGTAIQIRTRKTGQLVWLPCPRPLRIILDSIPPHDATTLSVNSRGRPWTGNGFRAVFRKLIKRLETEGKVGSGLSLHGLRHSFAVDLRELGYDERTIADALGQAEIETARIYARGADLRRKMTAVMSAVEKLDTGRKKRDGAVRS